VPDFEYLRPYARHNSSDIKKLDALLANGGVFTRASLALGINERNIRQSISELKQIAALKGVSPDHDMTHEAPAGYLVKGTSTLYGNDGEVKQQWVKTQVDITQRIEMIENAMACALEGYKGIPNIKPLRTFKKDMLTVYPFGDPHIGMYSYARETGADFDCDIATASMCGAVDHLCDVTPETETAIILSVGDTFHADTSDNKSLNSGHSFDVDTRWSRVLEIGVTIMIRCIERALQKHKTVIFKAMPGNHDKHTALMLAICISSYFRNNKRVIVDKEPAYYWYHQFGKVLIGATHGDQCKVADLPTIMADDRHEMWGKSMYRYWYTGHIHTKTVHEYRGVLCESFRTLAPRDAWHAAKGYGAGRDMNAIIHHAEFGEIERHRSDIRMLQLS